MKQIRPLNSFPAFSALDPSLCEALQEEGKVRQIRVKAAGLIQGGDVCCLQKGTAAVYAPNEAHPSLLRYLQEGDIFGMASVFAEKQQFSVVYAQTDVTLLAIPKETISSLIREYPEFAMAWICCLSDKIAFLNRKIACVTAGSAEQKLAAWLLAVSQEDSFVLPVSMSSLAKLLDIGRASLYRAFGLLEEKNLIQQDGTTVRILDRAALQALV